MTSARKVALRLAAEYAPDLFQPQPGGASEASKGVAALVNGPYQTWEDAFGTPRDEALFTANPMPSHQGLGGPEIT